MSVLFGGSSRLTNLHMCCLAGLEQKEYQTPTDAIACQNNTEHETELMCVFGCLEQRRRGS